MNFGIGTGRDARLPSAGCETVPSLWIFWILFVTVFAVMLGHGIMLPVLPLFAQDLGATGLWIGVIFSGYSLSRVVLMPLIGRLSDICHRRTVIAAGLALYTIFSLLYLAAYSPESLALIRFFHGFASAMVVPVAMAFAADLAPNSQEGRFMGTFVISFLLGMGLGPFIGGMLFEWSGVTGVFISMSALTAISLVICLYLPPLSGPLRKPVPLRQVFRERGMASPLFFQLIASFLTAVFIAFFPILARAIPQPVTVGQIGIIMSANLLLTTGLQYHFGKIADRNNKRYLLATGLVIIAVALAILPALGSFPEFLCASILMGIGSGVSIPAAVALMTVAGRSAGQGVTMGVFVTIIGIGMMIGPIVAGVVADAFGIAAVFFVCAAVSFGAVPVTLLLGKPPASTVSGGSA
jgi:MFS family permease